MKQSRRLLWITLFYMEEIGLEVEVGLNAKEAQGGISG
jgi:hypothetical protein